jgi:hypothetical protein
MDFKTYFDGVEYTTRMEILTTWQIDPTGLHRLLVKYKPTTIIRANKHYYLAADITQMLAQYKLKITK